MTRSSCSRIRRPSSSLMPLQASPLRPRLRTRSRRITLRRSVLPRQGLLQSREPGASTNDTRRPEFQRMMGLGLAKPLLSDVIVVDSFSRFSRDRSRSRRLWRNSGRAGCRPRGAERLEPPISRHGNSPPKCRARSESRLDGGCHPTTAGTGGTTSALAQRVELAEHEVRLSGPKVGLLRAPTAAESVQSATKAVRSFDPKWRPRGDSNTRPTV